MPLLNRQMQIPGGLRFVQPELQWQSQPWASFEVIVTSLIAARNAHPALVQKYNWNLDYGKVAQEVDDFNSRICAQMGWTKYISAGSGGQPVSAPFLPAPTPVDQGALSAAADKVKAIWSGVKTINDWEGAGFPAVPAEQSEARAAICAACPKNDQGDWTAWFTKPASEAIRRQTEKFTGQNLKTSHDDKLKICTICYCPMRLKVHTPMEYIKPHLTDAVLTQLRAVPGCWIPKEYG